MLIKNYRNIRKENFLMFFEAHTSSTLKKTEIFLSQSGFFIFKRYFNKKPK